MGLDGALRALADEDAPATGGGVALWIGTVTAVTAGGASDGHAQVTVSVNGSASPAPYLDTYTSPAVNDVVAVLLVDGSPLILGRRIGTPTF